MYSYTNQVRYPKPPILGSTIVKNITHIPLSTDGEESAIFADVRLKDVKIIIDQIKRLKSISKYVLRKVNFSYL